MHRGSKDWEDTNKRIGLSLVGFRKDTVGSKDRFARIKPWVAVEEDRPCALPEKSKATGT